MPRSFVTGGGGFIGSNLALELERLGHEVVALDNLHSGETTNLKKFRGQLLTLDLAEPFELDQKFDFIFHQAAITDPRYGNDEELYRKNVVGFENVVRLAQSMGAKLIYASTAGLYGNGPVPMREDQPKDILTVYGQSKLKMDEMAEALFATMHIVGLRYFNVFGPREAHKGRPASMVFHLWRQVREGNRPRLFKWGEQIRDFVYVNDVVYANLCAMEGKSGVYNVGTGVGTSFKELAGVLCDVMGRNFEPDYFDMPYDPKTYQSNTVADVTLAEKNLGFKAKWVLKDAIRDYIHWLEENYQQTERGE